MSHATLISISCIHVNTTKLCNIMCTLVATSVILWSLDCMIFHVTDSHLSFTIRIVSRGVLSPTLNVNPTLFVIPCFKKIWGIMDWQCCIYCHFYLVIFHPCFNHPWQYFITSWWQEKVGFWPTDELVHHPWQYLLHLFIRTVIRKVTMKHNKSIWLCRYSTMLWKGGAKHLILLSLAQ
jgi:hypothetical protein